MKFIVEQERHYSSSSTTATEASSACDPNSGHGESHRSGQHIEPLPHDESPGEDFDVEDDALFADLNPDDFLGALVNDNNDGGGDNNDGSTGDSRDGGSCRIVVHETNNYDVVLLRAGGGYRLADAESHVGNNRLKVILDVHRPAFEEALSRNDDDQCDMIATGIVDTICLNCVPNGRFLVKRDDDDEREDGTGTTTVFFELKSTELARDVVKGLAVRSIRGGNATRPDDAVLPPSPLLTNQTTSDGEVSLTAPLCEGVESFHIHSRSTTPQLPVVPESNNGGAPALQPPLTKPSKGGALSRAVRKVRILRRRPSSAVVPPKTIDEAGEDQEEEEEDDAKKRGRTSSLLRRSRQSLADKCRSVKAACQRKSNNRKSSKDTSSDKDGEGKCISEGVLTKSCVSKSDLTDSDVLVAGEGGEGLRPTANVGNNRLRVMIDMNRSKYATAAAPPDDDAAVRRAIVEEIVSLCRRNGGRFLREDPLTGLYHTLDDDLAYKTVHHCLSTKAGEGGAQPSIACVMEDSAKYRNLAIEQLKDKQRRKMKLRGVEKKSTKKHGAAQQKGFKLGASLEQRPEFNDIMRLTQSI